mgnify:CR=1 FL=1
MKARHEFKTDEEYDKYLQVYFIGKILSAMKPYDIIDFEEKTTEPLDCVIVNFADELIRTIKL